MDVTILENSEALEVLLEETGYSKSEQPVASNSWESWPNFGDTSDPWDNGPWWDKTE